MTPPESSRTDPPLDPPPALPAVPDARRDPAAAAAVARVVAWHNAHPLARRIGAEQVTGLGAVALPVRAVTGWRRWQHWRPVFDPQFTPRGHRAGIAAFAARHGQADPVTPPGWPQRVFDAIMPPRGAAPATELRHLLTAAIEVGAERRRVLIAPAMDGPLYGPRHWAPTRLRMAVAGALLPVLALAGWSVAHQATTPATAAMAAPAATAAALAAASAPPPVGAVGATSHAPAHDHGTGVALAAHGGGPAASAATAHRPASAAAVTAAVTAVADPAAPVAPASGTATATAAAAPASAAPAAATPRPAPAPAPAEAHGHAHAAAPAAHAASAPALAPATGAAGATAAASTPAPSRITVALPPLSDAERAQARAASQQARAQGVLARAAADPQVLLYALTTAPVRRQPQAAALRDAMRAAAARQHEPLANRFDVWPTAAGWQAAWWPFASAEDALKQRAALQAQGVQVSVVPF